MTLTAKQQEACSNAIAFINEAFNEYSDGDAAMLCDALNEADSDERQEVFENSYYHAFDLIFAALTGRDAETLAEVEEWLRDDEQLEY